MGSTCTIWKVKVGDLIYTIQRGYSRAAPLRGDRLSESRSFLLRAFVGDEIAFGPKSSTGGMVLRERVRSAWNR
jgi:hypothetical protein